MKNYDIAIIGAGPAGSMLARLLKGKGYKVAIFDARPLDRVFRRGDLMKSCGGLIAPDASEFLFKYGIEIPQEVISPIQSKWVKTSDFGTNVTRTYMRDYVNVDREAFDRFLAKDVEGDKFFNYRVKNIKFDGRFVIDGKFEAKILVGADGANSMVRRQYFPDFRTREYVSVQEGFEGDIAQDFECFFDNECTDYYGWRFTKESGSILGLAVPRGKDALRIFKKFKNKLGYKKELFREGAMILRPKAMHPILCKDNLFLIGEAGGYISPSSAEGFSYAFKTAEILAKSDFDLNKFKRKMLTIKASIFVKNIKSLFMYNPLLRSIIMRLSIRKNPTAKRLPKALDKLRTAKK